MTPRPGRANSTAVRTSSRPGGERARHPNGRRVHPAERLEWCKTDGGLTVIHVGAGSSQLTKHQLPGRDGRNHRCVLLGCS
ncbi:predicted protein [Streptomyces lividans TK24]|nr:predicted protein [Streptomyces lividans TK24]